MTQFRYTAIGPDGLTQRGELEAASERDAVAALQKRGLLPLRAEPATGGLLGNLFAAEIGGAGGISRDDLTEFTRELSVMLGAGQDIDRALKFLTEAGPSKKVRALAGQLRDTVRDGAPLATALGKHPKSFDRMYVGLVRAGEAGGNLAATLGHLAEMLERNRALASAITSALIYPALLTVASIGAVALLLTEVLPQFVPLFEQAGAKLPASTQALVDAGAFLGRYGLVLLIAALALFIVARVALRQPAVQARTDAALLRIPIIGGLSREVLAARFARTVGTLLTNGVALVATLGIAQETVGNTAAVTAIRSALASAKGGAGLSGPLGAAKVFPERLIHLLRLGEENAQLGPMALRAAGIHEERARAGLQRFVALLTPAITIVMGAVVAGIVSSLLLAMLSLNDLATQ